MKKIIRISYLVFGLFLAFNLSNYAQAQDGRIQVGPGLAYGNEAENLGISVDGYYTINDQFRAGAAFTYFFPENDINHYTIDLNGNYIFHEDEQLMAYAIAGLNIFTYSWDIAGVDDSETELGLNVGAGIEYGLNVGNLFGELKLTGIAGDADQLVLGAGIRFDI